MGSGKEPVMPGFIVFIIFGGEDQPALRGARAGLYGVLRGTLRPRRREEGACG